MTAARAPGDGRKRRPRSGSGADARTERTTVRFSPEETAVITAEASRSGLSPSAWIGQVCMDAAAHSTGPAAYRGVITELSEARGELRDAWLRMAEEADRLTGDAAAFLRSVAADVAGVADRLDQVTLKLGRRLP